jgi:hypothetical protein
MIFVYCFRTCFSIKMGIELAERGFPRSSREATVQRENRNLVRVMVKAPTLGVLS